MDNKIAIVVAIFALGFSTSAIAAKHAAPAKPLPIFDFMGSNTEEISATDQTDQSTCTTDGDKKSCTKFEPTLAGKQIDFLMQDFYKGKLYHVFGAFGEYAYGDLLSAFTTKYGASAQIVTRKWQSKGGSVFDNSVVIWHFKGGDLELDSMGLEVGKGSFEFTSEPNSPPAAPAKVDF